MWWNWNSQVLLSYKNDPCSLENDQQFLRKLNTHLLHDLDNSTLGNLKQMSIHILHTNVHSSFIPNSPEARKQSKWRDSLSDIHKLSEWINKLCYTYTWNTTLQ